jgi:MOSC domain-containing protein YiiM
MNKQELLNSLPQTGTVAWIGIRPKKGADLSPTDSVSVTLEAGLEGDHYSGSSKKRQVTLIQEEHLEGVAKILRKDHIDPSLTRRNILVRGINLLALKDRSFQIGEVILEGTGPCHPCSRMETNLGPGGYNAMRGHGGITARVVQEGTISVGDVVRLKKNQDQVSSSSTKKNLELDT